MNTQTTNKEHDQQFVKVAECLYRHTRSNNYYAFVKRNRKQIRKSLKTSDRKLAERLLADFRRKVGRLSRKANVGSMTFGELADTWFESAKTSLKTGSAQRVELSIKLLKKHFGVLSVRGIDTASCEEWQKSRGAEVGASAFNQDRGVLARILDYAVREGLLLDNPALVVERRKLPKRRIVIPSHEQFRKLVEQIRRADRRAEHGANLVELLAYSGMRLKEAVNLLWGDIDLDRGGTFTVTGGSYGTKNHAARVVPLFPAMRHLLERIRNGSQPSPEERLVSIVNAKKVMGSACAKAKLPRFTHHSLRHFFCSNAIELGVDFTTISNWVGHQDGGLLVAKTYGHLRDTHSFEMAKRMTFSAVSTNGEAGVIPESAAH